MLLAQNAMDVKNSRELVASAGTGDSSERVALKALALATRCCFEEFVKIRGYDRGGRTAVGKAD
jgi:hypothetical protein